MLRVPSSRLAVSLTSLAARAMRALWNACRPSGVAGGFIADLTRSRAELLTENALLRQQLMVASRAIKRPTFRASATPVRVLSDVIDPSMVRLMLESVGLSADAPHAARARDPTDLFAASGVD